MVFADFQQNAKGFPDESLEQWLSLALLIQIKQDP